VFEHFTCPAYVNEGWGPHSFTETEESHCRCVGGSFESEKVIELESDGVHYKLTRLNDEEYIESYNDSSVAITKDGHFFEESYDSREKYERAVKALERMKRHSKK
jgi:hypothetical protein